MNGTSDDARSERSGRSARSNSPVAGGVEKGEGGPQDIPSEKLGFGEDVRALRVLDRAFRT